MALFERSLLAHDSRTVPLITFHDFNFILTEYAAKTFFNGVIPPAMYATNVIASS